MNKIIFILAQVTLDSDNLTNDINDDALVILAKQTTLTETQKSVLRKGLKFIPKTRQLGIPIQALLYIQTLCTNYRQYTNKRDHEKKIRNQ